MAAVEPFAGCPVRAAFARLNGEYLWHAARHEPEFHELMCRVGLANKM